MADPTSVFVHGHEILKKLYQRCSTVGHTTVAQLGLIMNEQHTGQNCSQNITLPIFIGGSFGSSSVWY